MLRFPCHRLQALSLILCVPLQQLRQESNFIRVLSRTSWTVRQGKVLFFLTDSEVAHVHIEQGSGNVSSNVLGRQPSLWVSFGGGVRLSVRWARAFTQWSGDSTRRKVIGSSCRVNILKKERWVRNGMV